MQSFLFTPLSDEELLKVENEKYGLAPDGTYKFQVKVATKEISKTSGHPMIRLKIAIQSGDDTNTVIDYLVSTPKMMFKLKHFLDAIGMAHLYSNGNFDPLILVNKVGHAIIGTQKGNPKDNGAGNFPDKNIVKDYIKVTPTPIEKPVAKKPELFDDIPF
jgi:hypothetical protein